MTTNLMPAEGTHWAPVPLWALELLLQDGVSPAARQAFLAFWAARDRKTGIARLSRTGLMNRLGVTEPTARRATRQLEQLGLIRRENIASGGRGAWPRYFLALDDPHLFPYRANPSAPVTTVRGPRADVPRVPKRVNGTRPLVPSALPDATVENPVRNPVTTPENPVTREGGLGENPVTREGGLGQKPRHQKGDTKHLEVKQKQQQMRTRGGTGGGTPVPNAAAAVNGDTQKPRHEIPAELVALCELREAIGASGVLPGSREADERVRVWFAAGWTAVTLAAYLSERLNRSTTHTPAGLVLTILRDVPAPAPAPPAPEHPGDPRPCDHCSLSEWGHGELAGKTGDSTPYKVKGSNERAVAEEMPTSGPVRPSESPAVAELVVLGEQAHEFVEQALTGLSPEMRTFALTGQMGG